MADQEPITNTDETRPLRSNAELHRRAAEPIISAWKITCPFCGTIATEHEFQMSCADECFCPNCDEEFLFDDGGDEDQ